MKYFSVFVLGVLMLLGCQKEVEHDLREFYAPGNLMPGQSKQYVYRSVIDTLAPMEYWTIEKLQADGGNFLKTSIQDPVSQSGQINIEEVVESGVLLKELMLIDANASGGFDTTHATIDGDNAFPFLVKDSTQVYFYKVSWIQPDTLQTKIKLTRNRRFRGFTTYEYEGKKLDAVRFQLREMLVTETEGQTRSQWAGEEIYAKGIGLVSYRKDISPTYRLYYKLDHIE